MEELKALWDIIAPYITTTSISAGVGAIVIAIFKALLNKTLNKLNVGDISNNIAEKTTSKIKNVEVKTSIQPIIESGLKKVMEECNEQIKGSIGKITEQDQAILNTIECFASYFDGSFAVSDEKKNALANALEEAHKVIDTVDNSVVVTVETADTVKEESKEKTTSLNR